MSSPLLLAPLELQVTLKQAVADDIASASAVCDPVDVAARRQSAQRLIAASWRDTSKRAEIHDTHSFAHDDPGRTGGKTISSPMRALTSRTRSRRGTRRAAMPMFAWIPRQFSFFGSVSVSICTGDRAPSW
jgi:hypothetical protein